MDLKIDQVIFYGTVGLTNLFDVSLAVPINDVRFTASASALINRVPDATGSINLCVNGTSPCHYFEGGVNNLTKNFSNSGNATGVGHITLRLKHSLHNPRPGGQGLSAALLTDVRFPSGDEKNFLGSGSYGVKPFVAVSVGSTARRRISISDIKSTAAPRWRETSPGARRATFRTNCSTRWAQTWAWSRTNSRLPRTTWGNTFTMAPRIVNQPFAGLGGAAVPRVGLQYTGYNMSNVAAGLKYAIAKHLLLTGNVLVQA